MHELSLTENLLDVTLENAGKRKVINVNLLIGEFSHEREELLLAVSWHAGQRHGSQHSGYVGAAS